MSDWGRTARSSPFVGESMAVVPGKRSMGISRSPCYALPRATNPSLTWLLASVTHRESIRALGGLCTGLRALIGREGLSHRSFPRWSSTPSSIGPGPSLSALSPTFSPSSSPAFLQIHLPNHYLHSRTTPFSTIYLLLLRRAARSHTVLTIISTSCSSFSAQSQNLNPPSKSSPFAFTSQLSRR